MDVFKYTDKEISSSNFENDKFDSLLKERWNRYMENGNFRYRVDNVPRKVLPGKYGFIAEMLQNRKENRRPPQHMTEVVQKFDENKFSFTKVDPKKECLFSLHKTDEKRDSEDSLIINVSPISRHHSLVVPQLHNRLPQVLTEYSIILSLELMFLSQSKDFRLCFNSLCANASVNHLHWHILYFEEELYIQRAYIEKTEVENLFLLTPQVYPAAGFVFLLKNCTNIKSVARQVYALADWLICKNIAHNIYIARGEDPDDSGGECVRIFVWARESVVGAKSADVFAIAALELAGQILVLQPEGYSTITEEEVCKAQRDATLSIYHRIQEDVVSHLQFKYTSSQPS